MDGGWMEINVTLDAKKLKKRFFFDVIPFALCVK